MTLEPPSGDLRAFAEDPGAFVAIGPDEERLLTDRYSVTFTPGELAMLAGAVICFNTLQQPPW